MSTGQPPEPADRLSPEEEAEAIARVSAMWQADSVLHRFSETIYDLAERMAEHVPGLVIEGKSRDECIVHLLWRLWPPEAWKAGDDFLEEMAWHQNRVAEWEAFRAWRDEVAVRAGRGVREDGMRAGIFG